MNAPLYDTLGRGYAACRRPDPRWGRSIHTALGDAHTVLDAGAGTGSYEPRDRSVLAVEPSATMIAQRPVGSAPVVLACAENLPVPDYSFDAAMAVLTVHHWTDLERGITELRRVSRRQVVLTYDTDVRFWLDDYVPEIAEFERQRTPAVQRLITLLGADDGAVTVQTMLVPADMRDGVLAAYWRQPEAYLDPAVRACCSGLAQLDPAAVDKGVDQLREDLRTGRWHERYGHLLDQPHFDVGYRLLVAGRP